MKEVSTDNYKKILSKRNTFWEQNEYIPKWVDVDNVGLDQFFTEEHIAKVYYDKLLSFLLSQGLAKEDCLFIEPSAGSGSFFDILPKELRIGIDIMPIGKGIIEHDFLSWSPPKTNKKIVCIGNPPFGYRAWLALSFMNHAATFSDYIGFILPMAFQSDGKGSPKHRVVGMSLQESELLPSNSFFNPDGKKRKVNALWQIWEKGENIIPQNKECDQWIDLFTVDMRKERLCGKEKMNNANFFIQRTYYNSPPGLVRSFSEVKYVCGYGIIIKKEYEKVVEILSNTNWYEYSNLAAHNCRHISMYHIKKSLVDNGLVNA